MTARTGEKACEAAHADWFAAAILGWYDRSRRVLPWRAPPGKRQQPYKVWLSEIMLQQTTVKAVAPYYSKFLSRWPDVKALADAPLDDVLSAWAGLGYYARARNLHACANVVARDMDGRFPETEKELLKLPGIGAYTAAAIAAIAFDRQAAVVDGNVERVLARFYAVEAPLPKAKPQLRTIAEALAPAHRPGDFAQAMMDLGATVCTPRSPACSMCPVAGRCKGKALGIEAHLPYRAAKPERPTRHGAAFFALREDGAVLLRKRPAKGLLGGMTEVPGTPWTVQEEKAGSVPFDHAPIDGPWTALPGRVSHTFTHFHLELEVFARSVSLTSGANGNRDACFWVGRKDLDRQALPSVMRKVVAHALDKLEA